MLIKLCTDIEYENKLSMIDGMNNAVQLHIFFHSVR